MGIKSLCSSICYECQCSNFPLRKSFKGLLILMFKCCKQSVQLGGTSTVSAICTSSNFKIIKNAYSRLLIRKTTFFSPSLDVMYANVVDSLVQYFGVK